MKKIKLLTGLSTLTVLGLSSLPLTSCNKVQQFTVHFNTNGGSTIADIKVDKDSTITKPADPVMKGFEFLYWCSDEALTTEFDFNTKITSDLTLYAKWTDIVEISEADIIAQYTTWYNEFITSTLTYKKEDLRAYVDGEEKTVNSIEYVSTEDSRKFYVTLEGYETFTIAGQTPDMFEWAISGFKESKFYKSTNYIYAWGYDDGEGEQFMVWNKYAYTVYCKASDFLSAETKSLYISYLKEPTK